MVKSKSNGKKLNLDIANKISSIGNIHSSIGRRTKNTKFTCKYDCNNKIEMPNKRGRKPLLMDQAAKLQKCRQSAKDCRVRKKLRYQNLANAVLSRENENLALLKEYYSFKKLLLDVDNGHIGREILLDLNLVQ
ncbi:cAMP-responsive element-binding protein-like 2 [Trichoplax sp. H2]|nr:cAMP-responsive element-binding protein-like 2 [Trichoplax sp. H2]|eukprot:RDD38389.1 cAMP-responsive element-binding protein-like 2 [Trichoplax sp. H2]